MCTAEHFQILHSSYCLWPSWLTWKCYFQSIIIGHMLKYVFFGWPIRVPTSQHYRWLTRDTISPPVTFCTEHFGSSPWLGCWRHLGRLWSSPAAPGAGMTFCWAGSQGEDGAGQTAKSIIKTEQLYKASVRLLSSWPLVKILTGPVHYKVTLDTLSRFPESWSSKTLGSDRERTF